MKIQEALKILSTTPRVFNSEINEALDVSVDVMKRKIEEDNRPTKLAVRELSRMQPGIVQVNKWGLYSCPSCGFKFNSQQYKDPWCCKCGKRLEW